MRDASSVKNDFLSFPFRGFEINLLILISCSFYQRHPPALNCEHWRLLLFLSGVWPCQCVHHTLHSEGGSIWTSGPPLVPHRSLPYRFYHKVLLLLLPQVRSLFPFFEMLFKLSNFYMLNSFIWWFVLKRVEPLLNKVLPLHNVATNVKTGNSMNMNWTHLIFFQRLGLRQIAIRVRRSPDCRSLQRCAEAFCVRSSSHWPLHRCSKGIWQRQFFPFSLPFHNFPMLSCAGECSVFCFLDKHRRHVQSEFWWYSGDHGWQHSAGVMSLVQVIRGGH